MKQKSASVHIQNISVGLNSQTILKCISLEILPGSRVAILGTSGCGKSTLLKTIIGLALPNAGRVLINSTRMCPETALELRQEIGYCVQDGGLFPHLTLFQNITLMAKLKNWPASRISGRLEELLELTQLDSALMSRRPFQVSGGQRQRVSLIRALFLDPSLILLDEPMGALDPIVRSDLQDDLREIFLKLKKTVVMVTHDLGEAVYLSDRIVLMKDGRILQSGQVRDFVENPADGFVSKFFKAQRSAFDSIPGVSIA